MAFYSTKQNEQNRVWVGLAKETAHQLGTPTSSLLGWVEYLRSQPVDQMAVEEMAKDLVHLNKVVDRFSKIGSLPEPVDASMNDVLVHVIDYMDRRTSSQVQMIRHLPDHEVIVKMNASLFEWVVENLCKNAIDAMNSKGNIEITVRKEAYMCSIEVADTGKGIPPGRWDTIFMPGYTTKSRGWGLGLSLARRIVEEYHRGRIFVKSSDPATGTVFRIELRP
jgi:signal transduction histidine kinase